MKRFITDIYGQKYYIKVLENSADLFHVELRHRGEYVGEVKCILRPPDMMELSEIHIRDDSDSLDPGASIIESIMKSQAKSKDEMRNYREKGLGTALLELVIDHAREKQLRHIYGTIVEKDIIRTPNLVEWYKKRGFKKGSPYPGCIEKAVAWIYLELN